MRFVLQHIAGIDELAQFEAYSHATPDTVEMVLEEAAKLASEVWAPTNVTGDKQTSRISGNDVKTPDGFKDAYTKFAEGGWNALAFGKTRLDTRKYAVSSPAVRIAKI